MLENFLNPPVLFFIFGLIVSFLSVDVSIPAPVQKFISMYLLISFGFQGGVALQSSGFSFEASSALLAASICACIIPIYSFSILRKKYSVADAAALAATYGSVSVVTFIAAMSFLDNLHISYGGFMIAALALMDSPAIITGLFLARSYNADRPHGSILRVFKDTMLNSSICLLIGGLIIGLLSGQEGLHALKPFTHDIFKGMLSIFMLDMATIAAKGLQQVRHDLYYIVPFAVIIPVINACIAVCIATLFGLSAGNAFLLMVLAASASYISVPAAMRLSLPEANAGLYIPAAVGITFPFNIIVGFPLYLYISQLFGY